jgi:hypothetical protein
MRKWPQLVTTISGVPSLVLCLLIVGSSLNVCAQSASTGALTGLVTDPTGSVLQNSKISLSNYGTGETRTAITNQDGLYRFSMLPPGEYELRVEVVGFAPLVVRQVMIRITEVRSTFKLSPAIPATARE